MGRGDQLEAPWARRDDAITRARHGAPDGFVEAAVSVVRELIAQQETLTTDDVWRGLEGTRWARSGMERRAMGAAMVEAARQGLIWATSRTVESSRRACNCRPVRVWERV